MDKKVLQTILGYSDIGITLNTYCDVSDDFKQKHTDVSHKYMENFGLLPKALTNGFNSNDCNSEVFDKLFI